MTAILETVTSEVQKRLDQRARAKTDKLFLATEVLGYDFQPDVHAELFEQYLPMDEGKTTFFSISRKKDRLILWPRGHYKTTSIVVEAIQLILNYPDIRILLMQGTVGNTEGLLAEIKSHFDGTNHRSKLNELFPEFCTDKRLGSAQKFTVPARKRVSLKEATVTVKSPRAVKAGQHYDVGFFDDLVNELNYRNPKVLKKVTEDFYACQPLIDPGGYRYVTGTRYTFGDLYEQIIRSNNKGQWIISVKDCYSDDGKGIRFPQRTLPDGRLAGFTRQLLDTIREEDPVMFAAQYLNKPIHGKTQLFPESLMLSSVVSAKDEKFPALGHAVLFIDLASSQAGPRDHSVILCGRPDGLGRVYVTDARGDLWSPDALAKNVIEMALKHRPVRILIEGTAAGKYAMNYIRVVARDTGVNLPLDLIKVDNQADAKHIRISSVEGPLKAKRLFFLANLPRWDMILEQFTQYQPGRGHDDYADTVGLMIQHFQAISGPPPTPRHPIFEMMRQGTDITDTLLGRREPAGENELGADFNY